MKRSAGQLSLCFDVPTEDVADRAARLALSVAGVVARVRRASATEIQRARADLHELERLAGVADVELPPVARDISARGAWVGFAPPPDAAQDAAALACWAALRAPLEAFLQGWRAALRSAPRARKAEPRDESKTSRDKPRKRQPQRAA